jgi:ABC-type transport system substrate-binding protein
VAGLDQLIDQARFTIDLDLRRRTYARVQRLLKDESPSIFLFHEFETLATARTVEYAARGDQWLWLFDAKRTR